MKRYCYTDSYQCKVLDGIISVCGKPGKQPQKSRTPSRLRLLKKLAAYYMRAA